MTLRLPPYKDKTINTREWRIRNRCQSKNCKNTKYLSLYQEFFYCIIHAIDLCDDVKELPIDLQSEIKEILSLEDCHLKSELILKLKEQSRRMEYKRLEVLSSALN